MPFAMKLLGKFTKKRSCMADECNFSMESIDLLRSVKCDGEYIIATSRAILNNKYSDLDYNKDFMSIFILIDDESGGIVLDNYGKYNVASPRYYLTGNTIKDFWKNIMSSGENEEVILNSPKREEEILSIFNLYKSQFYDSLEQFKKYYGI